MRVDYRYLRLVSVPVYIVAVVLLVLVFVPSLNVVVGGSARWLKIGPLPAVHPAEIAKLAMVIYLAHWFAKRGTRISGFWSGTIPFLIIVAPILALVFREPDLGTTIVLGLTAMTMFFLAGGEPAPPRVRWAMLAVVAIVVAGLRGYQLDADPGLARTRGRTRSGPASTRSRACSRSASAGSSARAWARAGSPAACSCRTRATTTSSRSSARSSG